MTKYKFDWQDVVHGQIDIEADNGVEAEQLFREMSLEKRYLHHKLALTKKHCI